MATLHVGETATVKNNQVFFFFFPYVSFFLYTVYLHYVSLTIIKSVNNFFEKILTKNCARFQQKDFMNLFR